MTTPANEWRGNLKVLFELSSFHTAPQTRHQVEQFIQNLLASHSALLAERISEMKGVYSAHDAIIKAIDIVKDNK